jgi:uncharacterized protein YndB with AHSA1/START domain
MSAAASRQSKEGTLKSTSEGIAKTVVVNAPVEEVYRSVSTAEGFRGWWCKEVTGSEGKGGELVLKFSRSGHVAKLSLAETAEPTRVEWTVEDHNAMKEWVGTRIQFEIQSKGASRSEVNFLHAGLTPKCECYGPCDGAWGYLMGSLKEQLEGGKGTPA